MSEELKLSTELQDATSMQEEESMFSFQNIFTMLVLNWQWFLLSLFICLCGALIYLRYTTPVYQVSAKMLIKEENRYGRRSTDMLSNMQNFGFISNSAGIDNEMEILQSSLLARDAVKDLKLYVEYRSVGRILKPIIYGSQPVNVDMPEEQLEQWDQDMLEGVKSIVMTLKYNDKKYEVEGKTLLNGKEQDAFEHTLASLPDTISTEYGTLLFSMNEAGPDSIEDGSSYIISVYPPMIKARSYVVALNIAPTSKMTTIAELTLRDKNLRRGLDFLRQLAICYNRQANEDKNEIAMKTEEFVNSRLEKIDAELGSTENALEIYKKRNSVTKLEMDATQSLTQSTQYESRLTEASSQIQLLNYLREFVDNPANAYKIIPSNIGMTDHASTELIASYNKAVQERNRLLKAASEQAPQVKMLTATLDELQSSIRIALLQARRTVDIQRQNLQQQYAKYQGRIGNTPEQERVLNQIGRQQEVKSGLYLLLLQKREENSISLAATADKGKLIDEPQYNGKVSPRGMIILLVAMVLGLAIPFFILFLNQLLSFRIEGREDLARLTRLPLVGDVPVASDSMQKSERSVT